MKYISRLLGLILAAANVLAVIGLWVCAFSSHISPVTHPVWSCAGLAFPLFLGLNVLFIVFWLVVYRYYIWMSAVGLLVAYGPLHTYLPLHFSDDDPPYMALKVVSWNCESYAIGAPHSDENPNPVLDYLARSGADLICLQEAHHTGYVNKKLVDRVLHDYPYCHYQLVNCTGLALYSRYPILSAKRMDVPSKTNGAMVYRVKLDEDTLTVMNVHLESNKLKSKDREIYLDMMKDPEKEKVKSGSKQLLGKLADAAAKRAPQADSIAAFIRRHPEDLLIVCGDFNDSPLSYAHRVIGERLTDAFTESGNGLGITYHENRFFFRIDHILVGDGLRTYRCSVDRSVKASDHYPISCYIAPKFRDYTNNIEQ